MFESFSLSFDTIAIVVRAAFLVGAFAVLAKAFTLWRRAAAQDTQWLSQQLERALSEIRALKEDISVLSKQIEHIGASLDSDARVPQVMLPGAQRGYDIAARLAKNGASVQELMASCGVTRHEAELLVRLHGKPRGASPETPVPTTEASPPKHSSDVPVQGKRRGVRLSVAG